MPFKKGQTPWNKGKGFTDDHRKALSESHKGQQPWNKGLKGVQIRSADSRAKFSEYAKAKGFGRWRKGKGPWNKGRKGLYVWSKTQREKWETWALSEEAQAGFKRNGIRAQRSQKKSGTAPERAIEEMLKALGVVYESQTVLADMTIADFYLPEHKIVIYADGDYWHKYPNGTQKDRMQTTLLTKLGFIVLRFWERDIATDRLGVLHRLEYAIKAAKR